MKGFTENLCAPARSVINIAAILSVSVVLTACGGGGGGGDDSSQTAPSATDTVVTNNPPTPPAVAPRDEDVVATALLPSGLTGDGENLYLDDTDASRGDDNDSPFSAFGLASDATVLGAVTAAEADKRDFFLVELTANQWLTLQSTEPTLANADLFLYDIDMNLQSAGMGPTAIESLQVPRDGSYYLEVAHAGGGTNSLVKYRLDLLPPGVLPAVDLLQAASHSTHEQLIPGQVIVSVKDHAGVITPHTMQLDLDTDLSTIAVKSFANKSQQMVVGRVFSQASKYVSTPTHKDELERRSLIANKRVRQAYDTLVKARQLQSLGSVVAVEPDQLLYSNGLSTANDADANKQWAAEMIDVEGAWPSSTGSGVTVAVLDSAFLTQHPDLIGRMQPGFDFVDDDTDVQASSSLSLHHGTHVAGIIAAARNNNAHIAGIAPDATVMPLRVMGDCLCGSMGDIIQGLRYAAGLPNASGRIPAVAAKVANLSLQLPYGNNAVLLQTLEDVTAAGTTVVWAAGNRADRHSYDEAGISGVPGVIIVAAVGSFQKLSSYSNYGSAIDLAAPGGDLAVDNGAKTITSLDGYQENGQWAYSTTRMQGSSQAAPFVSGVIALMASVWPQLTPAAIDALIEDGRLTRDIGLAGNDDYYGAGLLDASLAVQTALMQVGSSTAALQPKRIVALPSEINFGSALDVVEMDIFSTDPSASNLQLTYAPAWLSVRETQTAAGYGFWKVTVDRQMLSQQSHKDIIRFANGERQLVVPVSAHNPIQSSRGTGIAKLLVQFHDANSQQLIYQAYATPEAGQRFVLASDVVPAGTYKVRASSDFDNDKRYCEAGEVCGYVDGNPNAELVVAAGRAIQFELPLQVQ